jgi:hypothetical protein
VALDGEDFILDTVASWADRIEEDKFAGMTTQYRLVFKPKLHFAHLYRTARSEAAVRIYYQFAFDEVVFGSMQIVEKLAGKLAAIALIVEHGTDAQAAEAAFGAAIPNYLPIFYTFMWRQGKKLSKRGIYLVEAVLKLYRELLTEHPGIDTVRAMRLYLTTVQEISSYGTTQVRCNYAVRVSPTLWHLRENKPKQKKDTTANELDWVLQVDLGVNENGVFLFDYREKKLIAQHSLDIISHHNYRKAYAFFYYIVNEGEDEKAHIFQVAGASGKTLCKLIEAYKCSPSFHPAFDAAKPQPQIERGYLRRPKAKTRQNPPASS